jgi:hypothetical protein
LVDKTINFNVFGRLSRTRIEEQYIFRTSKFGGNDEIWSLAILIYRIDKLVMYVSFDNGGSSILGCHVLCLCSSIIRFGRFLSWIHFRHVSSIRFLRDEEVVVIGWYVMIAWSCPRIFIS